MQGYKSKENIKKKRKISKVFKCLVFHLILLAFLPINTRVSGNTLQYEFRAIRTHPFIHGQYAPCCVHVQYAPVLISHNTHQFEFMCSAYWSLCTCNIDQVSIHGQYESYAYLEQYAPTFIGYKHSIHILGYIQS